jgi:hypothetical protein
MSSSSSNGGGGDGRGNDCESAVTLTRIATTTIDNIVILYIG